MPERFKNYVVVETFDKHKHHHHEYILDLDNERDVRIGSILRKENIIKRTRTLNRKEIEELIEFEAMIREQ
jgi:hypothetical protein